MSNRQHRHYDAKSDGTEKIDPTTKDGYANSSSYQCKVLHDGEYDGWEDGFVRLIVHT
eukprot:CAMPEP_0184858488 /NCGR_PEP_ID=MMETSP0580-20130426/3585_1 /TAXON_ID=1118495 /ORGANISM="Dactyliosolen fragilissimus" /LENGTH=57 /DNA_ID=CAMNT_0027354653 /DNA_START=39 /DNA_END=208 /DNA_ORIENTATION=+